MEQHMEQSGQGKPSTIRLTPLGIWVSGRVRRLANGSGSENGRQRLRDRSHSQAQTQRRT